jgi:glycosyltransferase involved in cell wall biosynthesis
MIIQYAGDFREAYHRLMETNTETYYGHRYVLEQLQAFRETYGEVAITCCLSPERYHETLPNGVTVIGAKTHPKKQFGEIRRILKEWNPTHLVVLGPLTAVIRWGIATDRRVICQFADSFDINPLVRFLRYGPLAKLLNDRRVEWVSNHGVNACRSLARLGVSPDKILAWDWSYTRRPDDTPPRNVPPAGPVNLLYVGTLQPKKGVGDAISAVAELRRRGRPVTLKIVGGGSADAFREQAGKLGVADDVEFVGRIENSAVFEMMKAATAVVVPSRHDYPEGLPLTIYETLCARTPIIASDHPMFAGHLVDRDTAMVFPAKDSVALADRVEALLDEPGLYAKLSLNGALAWQRMQNPVKWGDVIRHWLSGAPEDEAWLKAQRVLVGKGV